MSNYLELILGSTPDSFKSCFEREWISFLKQLPNRYASANQLLIGNRLRPCLVCWGFALSTSQKELVFDKIIPVAIAVELVHKSSIILDDFIDDDDARRGELSFHKEFSPNEAVMFSMLLISEALKIVSDYSDLDDFIELIKNMSLGALEELSIDSHQQFSKQIVDEIVQNETVELLRNSFMFGYSIGGNKTDEEFVKTHLNEVLVSCAYAFQLLNDLEPFTREKDNTIYKANQNFDFSKNRKSIIVVHIYEACTDEERQRLLDIKDSDEIYKFFNFLIAKYNIKYRSTQFVERTKTNIFESLMLLQPYIENKVVLADFITFVNKTIDMCYLRI